VEPLGHLDVVAIDCNDPEPLVKFWCAVLGAEVASRGGDWIELTSTVAGGAHLAFQVVPEPKITKNRVHLDVTVDDLVTSAARAEQLGARPIGGVVEEGDDRYQVMADPAGNEFCLVEED